MDQFNDNLRHLDQILNSDRCIFYFYFMLKKTDILYNPTKHHLSHLQSLIRSQKDIESLNSFVKILGGSKMDLYYGQLSVDDLLSEVISLIPAENRKAFASWIESDSDYQTIKVSDSSEWILRYAENDRFIHLHPGRYTKSCIRVNANVLKTALLSVGFLKYQVISKIDTFNINEIRIKFLGLSPIDSLDKSNQINLIVDLLINY